MIKKIKQGFTLIEVVVALSIFAILSIIGYKGVSSLIETKQRVEAEDVKWQQLISFLGRFERDVKQSVNRTIRNHNDHIEPAWLGQPSYAGTFGAQLVFSRFGDPSQSGFLMDTRRVGYRLHEGAVELLIWPSLDIAPTAQPEVFVVLPDVAQFQIRYLSESGKWHNTWPLREVVSVKASSNLRKNNFAPSAVKLMIKFQAGEVITRIFAL